MHRFLFGGDGRLTVRALEGRHALLAGEHAANDVFFDHIARNTHARGHFAVAQPVELVQDERLAATRRQRVDRGDQRLGAARRFPYLLGLARHVGGGLVDLVQLVDDRLSADCSTAMRIDDEIARSAIEQAARVADGRAGVAQRKHANVAFLGDIRSGVTVFHQPGKKTQQFAVIAFDH
ncbi:hypothetical protein PT2222_220011 [Paraburkholderia tropica]